MKRPFFSDKKVLLVSPEPWSHLFISKHHYAVELAKTNNVFFLNPPGEKIEMKPTEFKDLQELNYTGFVKGLRFMPRLIQQNLLRKKYEQLEGLAGTAFDVIWSFDNSVFYDFDALPDRLLKILHLVDFSQDFQFDSAAESADVCLAISDNIVEKLKDFNYNSFRIPHGLHVEPTAGPAKLPGKNKVKAVYAGNLDMRYIDWVLAGKLTVNFQQVDFIFLGPCTKKQLDGPNVFFPGKIDHQKLQGYFSSADILLIIYNHDAYPEQLTNSHKVLEYLLSGTEIISTWLSDFKDNDLFIMAKTHEEYERTFSKISSDAGKYNLPDQKKKRIAFAMDNTYEVRLNEIEAIAMRFLEERDSV